MLLAIFVMPFVILADGKKIYVDDNASGTQDGTSGHPYKTISVALKHADEDTEVHIAAGTYKENIEIPEGVEIFGENKDTVIIEAEDDDEPVIDTSDHNKINKVTVKKGKYGIEVGKDDKVSIIKCTIKDNDKDGVRIKEGKVDDKHKVSITDSEIRNNGWSGIYSEKRRIVLINNDIHDNDGDGIDLEAGTKAWIDQNKVKNNDGSGLKVTLDGSSIWTDDNSFSENEREGVEVNTYGGTGIVDIKDNHIHDDDRFGIARVQRGYFPANIWNGLVIHSDNIFYGNKYGNVSHIVIVN